MPLTHYTNTIDSLIGILQNGFAYRACQRHLAESFVPEHNWRKREPQAFGAVSFTELQPEEAMPPHFGRFGIVVSYGWSRAHRVERVIYARDEGPAFEAWTRLFQIGYRDLKAKIPNLHDAFFTEMAFENKAAAAVAGGSIWAVLLQLYEYMEAGVHSKEREWRIVQREPLYSAAQTPEEAVARASPPEGWGKYVDVLPIKKADVEALVCPRMEVGALRAELPDEYEDIKIVETKSH